MTVEVETVMTDKEHFERAASIDPRLLELRDYLLVVREVAWQQRIPPESLWDSDLGPGLICRLVHAVGPQRGFLFGRFRADMIMTLESLSPSDLENEEFMLSPRTFAAVEHYLQGVLVSGTEALA